MSSDRPPTASQSRGLRSSHCVSATTCASGSGSWKRSGSRSAYRRTVSRAARARSRRVLGPRRSDHHVHRLILTYPQDAQMAVEMLIIQRPQIACFSCRRPLAACPERPYLPSCAEGGAGVGRSSTGRSYGAARKGRNGKSTGVVDETATTSANFFGPPSPAAAAVFRLDYDRREMQIPPRQPSIDQGVIALIWAIALAAYIYFGLKAVGASGATAIVLSLVSFAGIWLLVRLRGEEPPARRRRS
jgi:hypothetical protein